ncbi:MAG: HEAT repeat domain-containing protein [Planctomycetes bacterium]|nr:HEAT repeat domain-containing protein [Planctomycetota bacterium]
MASGRRTLLLGAPLLGGCASFGPALGDLEVIHEEQSAGVLVHRAEVTRPSALGRTWLGSPFGRWSEGLDEFFASPRKEEISDPDRLCRESLRTLKGGDLEDADSLAEAVHWASFLLEEDPHPLSRTEAALVLASVPKLPPSAGAGPSAGDWKGEEAELIASLRALTARLEALRREEALDPAGREELARRIDVLGAAPYRRSAEARGVARSLARLARLERDEVLRTRSENGARAAAVRAARLSLRKGLSDSSEFVREACLEGIVRLEGEGVLPDLGAALVRDPSPAVRRRVVRLVAKAPSPAAGEEAMLEFLVRLLEDPDASVSANAMDALSQRTGRERTLDREHWRGWWSRRLLERASGGR